MKKKRKEPNSPKKDNSKKYLLIYNEPYERDPNEIIEGIDTVRERILELEADGCEDFEVYPLGKKMKVKIEVTIK